MNIPPAVTATARIERVRMGQVEIGDRICEVDDDRIASDAELNDCYSAMDQDWAEVTGRGGHADIGWLEFTNPYTGEPERSGGDWDLWVWRLVP
jgi:hypothetical protein